MYIFRKTLSLSIVYSKYDHEDEKIFKKEEWIERLKIPGSINNIEEYQKTYVHVWRKHQSRILTEKYRWGKKLFNWRDKSKWVDE